MYPFWTAKGYWWIWKRKWNHCEKLSNIEKEIEILKQHEEEIVSKRVSNEKISYLKKIISERDDRINEMEEKIGTLEKKIKDSYTNNVKAGLEKDRQEKDAHVRAKHTFECNICDLEYTC